MDPKELEARMLALQMLASNRDEARIQEQARQEQELAQPQQQIIDRQVLEDAAALGGYRGQFGAHPAPVGGAPGIQFRMESDTAIQPKRPKRGY